MEKQKIKVSEKAEKELADLCDKLFEWDEKKCVSSRKSAKKLLNQRD